MKSSNAIIAFATLASAAYFDNATYGPGGGLENFSDLDSTQSVLNNINQTAPFDLVYQGGYNTPTWNLTVNVTKWATTLQTINTVYSLGLPSNASANATVSEVLPLEKGQNFVKLNASTPLCATIVQTLFSENVTNHIDGLSNSTRSGNCFNAIGIQCFNAITKAMVEHDTDDACLAKDLDLSDLEECEDVFGRDDFKSSTIDLNSNTTSLRNGEAFWHTTFEGQNVTNSTTDFFQAESSRMHMVIFQAGGEISPICVRPNVTVEANGDDPSTGAAPAEGGVGALGVNVWGMLGVVAGVFAFVA